MKPLIPTILKRIESKDFTVRWAWLKRKDGDWDPETGEIRLHWRAGNPVLVFVHEALHDLFPRAKEGWIWSRTYGIEKRLTKKQREKITAYLDNTRSRQKRVKRA